MDNEILVPKLEDYLLAGKIHGELLAANKEIGRADVIIASVAINNQLTLVTGNQKHFRYIQEIEPELILENWRE